MKGAKRSIDLKMLLLVFGAALIVVVFSCAFDPEITRKASVRRGAGGLLDSCLKAPPGRPMNEKSCKDLVATYCRDAGLEPTCGHDDFYWSGK